MNIEKYKRKIKLWIGKIGFKLFIWGNESTEEQFWREMAGEE